MLSHEWSDMSDRWISDLEAHVAHLFYITQELKKVAQYSPVITLIRSTGNHMPTLLSDLNNTQ